VRERLTEQIASFLDSRLQPAGVMIVVQARHFCMEMRGVRKAGGRTTTSSVRGGLADARRRREFLARIRRVR
jgi:GTP cyclohydrolase I